MTPSKKLFIAATLLAVGYGLATLFGTPAPRHLFEAAQPVGGPVAAATRSNRASGGLDVVGSVRLLPDIAAAATETRRAAELAPASASTINERLPLATSSPVASSSEKFAAEPRMPLLESRLELRAALKDETPRAFPDAGRPSQQSRSNQVDTIAYASPASNSGGTATNQEWPVGYTTAGPTPSATIRAPAEPPLGVPRTASQVGPPPWPIGDVAPQRTHVVVDGDSLAKLAGRYLDDPRRSEEIFALNRAVLSDPELLPIGMELKIPNAGRPRGSFGDVPSSAASGSLSVHSAAHTGLVPVQPIPATHYASPRAELLRPLPAD